MNKLNEQAKCITAHIAERIAEHIAEHIAERNAQLIAHCITQSKAKNNFCDPKIFFEASNFFHK